LTVDVDGEVLHAAPNARRNPIVNLLAMASNLSEVVSLRPAKPILCQVAVRG
jgi:hypothetical protein